MLLGVTVAWHVSHREHNRLMHALHGNGTPARGLELDGGLELDALHGVVVGEFHDLVAGFEAQGQLDAWLVDNALASRPVRDLWLSVSMRAQKRNLPHKAALKAVVADQLQALAKEARKQAGKEKDTDEAKRFLVLVWTCNIPPFYFFLTQAGRVPWLQARVRATHQALLGVLRELGGPSALAVKQVANSVQGGPRAPDGSMYLYRGLPSRALLGPFVEDVRAGRLTAFSLSPSLARTFGPVVFCVVVRAADVDCFAHLVTKTHGHEAEALLYTPCALANASPQLVEALGAWADECFELSSLGGPEGPAGVASTGAANDGPAGEGAVGGHSAQARASSAAGARKGIDPLADGHVSSRVRKRPAPAASGAAKASRQLSFPAPDEPAKRAKTSGAERRKQQKLTAKWATELTLAGARACVVDFSEPKPRARLEYVVRPTPDAEGVPYDQVKDRFAAEVRAHFDAAVEQRGTLEVETARREQTWKAGSRRKAKDAARQGTAEGKAAHALGQKKRQGTAEGKAAHALGQKKGRLRQAQQAAQTRKGQATRLRDAAQRTARAHVAHMRGRLRLLDEPEATAQSGHESSPLLMLDLVNNINGAQILHPTEALRYEDVDDPDPEKVREAVRVFEQYVHVFPEEKMQMVREVLRRAARDKPFLSCSVCGVRDMSKPCENMVLTTDLDALLRLSASKAALADLLGDVTLFELDTAGSNVDDAPKGACDVSHLVSFVEFNGVRYALHEEHVQRRLPRETDPGGRIVDGDGMVLEFQADQRCRGALASGRLPALCLPRGHDFGRLGHKTVRPFLSPPSDAEKLALAPVRLYGIVTKVVAPGQNSTSAHCLSSKLSGHFISFPQAGPVTMAQEVDVLAQLGSLHEALRAVFVGPQGTRDALLHRLKRCPNMQLRPALMWNYLTVLRLVSESEQRRADDECPASDNEDGAPGEERSKPRRMPNVTGVIPPLAAVRAACDAAWSAIEANSRHTTDMKSDLAARVAANDVAAVRAKGADAGAALGGESPVEGRSTSGAARRATGAGASVPLEGENPLGDLLEPPPTNAGMTVEKVALLERAQPGSAELEAAKVKAIRANTVQAKRAEGRMETAEARTVQIARGANPLSEFSDNAMLISNAFWWLFPLSGHWLPSGSLNGTTIKHILLQHTATAATDRDFVVMIGDQKLRHSGAASVHAKMLASPRAWAAYHATVSHPNFPALVEAADKNPTGPESRRLQRKVLPFLQLCSAQQPWSAAERKACISDLWALARRFGTASLFWTIAFDDVHDPRVMRLSLRAPRNGQQSEAMVRAFSRRLFEGKADGYDIFCMDRPPPGDGEGPPDDDDPVVLEFQPTEEFMQKCAAQNPVATSMVYDTLLRVTMGVLIGTPPSDAGLGASSKTLKVEDRPKGIAGLMLASYVVTEVTGKCTKHGHGLGFGGPMPAMLSNVAHFRSFVEQHVLPALQSHVRSAFPTEFHVVDAARHAVEQGRGRQTAPYAPQDKLHELTEAPLCGELADVTAARMQAREQLPLGESVATPAPELAVRCPMCVPQPGEGDGDGYLCSYKAVQQFMAQLGHSSLRTAGTRQSHTWHHLTCHKGAHGEFHCRLGAAFPHPTRHLILELVHRVRKANERPREPPDALDVYEYLCQLPSCDRTESMDYSAVLPRAPTEALHRGICAPPLAGEALDAALSSPASAAEPSPAGGRKRRQRKPEEEEEEEGREGDDEGAEEGADEDDDLEGLQLGEETVLVADEDGADAAALGSPFAPRLYQAAPPLPPLGGGKGLPATPACPRGEAGVVSSRTRSRTVASRRAAGPSPARTSTGERPTGTGAVARESSKKRKRVTFVDPLIPLPERRLLCVEPLRPPTIAPDERVYDNLLKLLTESSDPATGRVNSARAIDGPKALRVVVELFRTPAIARTLADEGLTSDALRDAIGEMGDAVDRPTEVGPKAQKQLEAVATRIVLALRRLPCRNAQARKRARQSACPGGTRARRPT